MILLSLTTGSVSLPHAPTTAVNGACPCTGYCHAEHLKEGQEFVPVQVTR